MVQVRCNMIGSVGVVATHSPDEIYAFDGEPDPKVLGKCSKAAGVSAPASSSAAASAAPAAAKATPAAKGKLAAY